jgi:esterase/lipase
MALAWGRLFPRLFEQMVADNPQRWMADRYPALREAKRKIRELNCPILAIHAKNNMELDHRSLDAVRRGGRHKDNKVLLLDDGGHRLLHGKSSSRVERELLDFIRASSRS